MRTLTSRASPRSIACSTSTFRHSRALTTFSIRSVKKRTPQNPANGSWELVDGGRYCRPGNSWMRSRPKTRWFCARARTFKSSIRRRYRSWESIETLSLRAVERNLANRPAAFRRCPVCGYHMSPSYEAREQSLKEVMEDFVRKGVTSIYDFPSGDGMQIYQNLRDEGRLPLRLRCQIILTGKDLAFQQFVLNDGPRTGFGDDWLRLGGIKLFVDGE